MILKPCLYSTKKKKESLNLIVCKNLTELNHGIAGDFRRRHSFVGKGH